MVNKNGGFWCVVACCVLSCSDEQSPIDAGTSSAVATSVSPSNSAEAVSPSDSMGPAGSSGSRDETSVVPAPSASVAPTATASVAVTSGANSDQPAPVAGPTSSEPPGSEPPATAGDTTAGDTTEGDTTEADTTEADTTEADTTEGDTTEGDTTEGDTTEGDTTEGDTTAVDSSTQGSDTEPAQVTCPGTPLAPGQQTRTIDVGGVTRSYILYVPSSYQGNTAVPLVLDFHPLGGTANGQMGDGFRTIADQEGFVVAYPDGIDNAWDIGPCCTNSDVDDLGFALAMVTTISAEACIDAQRVYATGTSMGGGMSMFLACNAADVFAAVAPAAFDLLIEEEEPCDPARAISVIAFRGTADTIVPFEGGMGPNGRVTFLGAEGTFERWSELDGCSGAPSVDANGCTLNAECDAGTEVALCIKQGGGHENGEASVAWSFLKRHTLPE